MVNIYAQLASSLVTIQDPNPGNAATHLEGTSVNLRGWGLVPSQASPKPKNNTSQVCLSAHLLGWVPVLSGQEFIAAITRSMLHLRLYRGECVQYRRQPVFGNPHLFTTSWLGSGVCLTLSAYLELGLTWKIDRKNSHRQIARPANGSAEQTGENAPLSLGQCQTAVSCLYIACAVAVTLSMVTWVSGSVQQAFL